MKPLLVLFLLVLSACVPANVGKPNQITVFAASSLTEAFTELGARFEASHPGTTIIFNFAGTHALVTQIEHGASTDIFASANSFEMDVLIHEDYVSEGSPRIFALNRLVVIVPDQNPADFQSLEDLSKPDLKLVMASEEVPAGRYALHVLDNLEPLFGVGFKSTVLSHVVSYDDNVRQVLTRVQLGEADAGLVYFSDAFMSAGLKVFEIPARYNILAEYPIAVLTGSPEPILAADFISFILSASGQTVLNNWGFTPVDQ